MNITSITSNRKGIRVLMSFDRLRRALLIPSRKQWSSGSQPTKQTAISYGLTVLGIVFAIVSTGAGIYALTPAAQPKPAALAYDLSEQRKASLLELLRVPAGVQSDTLRIGCLEGSESSCIAAGKFLTLFSEAGWQIAGDRVYRMDASVPVEGMTITTHDAFLDSLPKLPPHLGRWGAMDKSNSLIVMAFKYMDSPLHFSSDPELSDNMLGVYFGPNAPALPTMTSQQKELRRPLMDYVKTGMAVEQACSLDHGDLCQKQATAWTTAVQSYIGDGKLGKNSVTDWAHSLSDGDATSPASIEKRVNLLILLFLGIA